MGIRFDGSFLILNSIFNSEEASQISLSEPGILGTIVLAILVLLFFLVLLSIKVLRLFNTIIHRKKASTHTYLANFVNKLSREEVDHLLNLRDQSVNFEGVSDFQDLKPKQSEKTIITNIENEAYHSPLFDKKKTSVQRITIDPQLKKIVIAYLASSIVWLILGTLAGQYLGLKFVWPDLDHLPWLSFGRLRPVHTNMVFWGWASLAMLGLGHFVVSRTCNTVIYSKNLAWIALTFINTSVITGSLCLMNGINNGGGEYREYIWPVALLFAIGLLIALYNFVKTISKRNTHEIYVSNWYIMGACTWTLILVIIGYLPFYQNGLGETIIQGYYMHQGVGMWFMTFTLGLVYYFLPQALNKPIYSYSLGVLAFWTQMLFYTMIGTHHFIFSPLPWSLQTIAIVFSAGMLIPVAAGTTNFIMTFKGAWTSLKSSYVLPFLLVGVVFYFVGSAQGTMQAFRYSNLVWHLNDFNVAHSHMTMYGIITFFMWGGIYYLLPKLTGKNPSELMVGAHFWMAFVGLNIYMWSMMIGGTSRGVSWLANKPFIESVVLMAPYWLWRAIGGTMMFLSHLIFAYNFIKMSRGSEEQSLTDKIFNKFNLLKG